MHNYSSLNDAGETKSRKTGCGKHVVRIGKWKIQIKFQ
jgi:hypothetical protein